jgi:hypothetical protein
VSTRRRFDWLFRPHTADEDLPLSAEARFAEALAELPAVERSALALSEIGGLDTEEIARYLGTEPAVVTSVLARARHAVRASLAARGRGLAALLPLQSWWQTGGAAPAARAAGTVAATVLGTGVVIGGASADPVPPAQPAARDAPRVLVVAAPRPAAPEAPPAQQQQQQRAVVPAPEPPAPEPAAAAAPGTQAVTAPPPARRAPPAAKPAPVPRPRVPGPPARPAEPAPDRPSAGQVDGPARLPLVGVPAVPGGEVGGDHAEGPVLHLPDVAELVRDEVVGSVLPPEQDRPPERIPVIAP